MIKLGNKLTKHFTDTTQDSQKMAIFISGIVEIGDEKLMKETTKHFPTIRGPNIGPSVIKVADKFGWAIAGALLKKLSTVIRGYNYYLNIFDSYYLWQNRDDTMVMPLLTDSSSCSTLTLKRPWAQGCDEWHGYLSS